jgi:flagellar biosynthesis/type III secretory pathway chaperone
MENMVEQIAEILNQENEVFNQFLNLLDCQHKQIINGDLEELKQTNSRLDMLSERAQVLEQRRTALVDSISDELKLADEKVRLVDLLPHIDKFSSNRLQILRESILGAHKQIQAKNIRNKKLIDKSRQLIAESLKIITARPSPTYQKPGPGQTAVREANLINRSI